MVEKLHKVEDIAPIVNLTKQGLYAAIRAGQFPHIKIGTRIRIPESALQSWIQQQVTKNTSAQNQDQSLATAA